MKLSKAVRIAIVALAACVLLYFFPLFRVRKLGSTDPSNVDASQLDSAGDSGSTTPRAAETFVQSLWTDRLPAAADNATTVDDVLALAATDASAARKRFGREVGLGGPTFLFLRGRGQIESVNDEECRLIIDGHSQRIALDIGILFGNAVRDATGLINVDDFPNSQAFNNLSAELNSRCEAEVIEPVRNQLVVGAMVEFVGCGEVRDSNGFNPLKLIPVQLRVLKTGGTTE